MQALPRPILILLLLVLFLPARNGAAQSATVDVVGMWDYTLDLPDGAFPGAFTITSQDGALAGFIQAGESQKLDLKNVKVDGQNLSYELDHPEYGLLKVTAALSGDTYKGNLTAGDGSSFPIHGAKKKAAGFSTAASKIGDLLANEKTKAVLEKYLPGISQHPQIDQAKDYTLEEIAPYANEITPDVLKKIQADLSAL